MSGNMVYILMSDDWSPQPNDHASPKVTDGGSSLATRVFEALANQRRRYVLYYLCEENQVTVDELATGLAAWEDDAPPEKVPDCEVEAMRTVLVHTLLPKLEDLGFLDHERPTGTVRSIYLPEFLHDVLELSATVENPP